MGYVLKEVTAYHDGTTRTGSQIQFILNEEAEITTIAGFDKKDEVLVGKEDLDGNKISGAVLQILDKEEQCLKSGFLKKSLMLFQQYWKKEACIYAEKQRRQKAMDSVKTSGLLWSQNMLIEKL